MNDKTLVERLLEAKPVSCADFARMFGIECQEQKDCITCKHIVCCSIANAIEGEYIPRPRYEDGEPVQFGDTYTDKKGREWKNGIKSIHIDCNGDFSLHDNTIGNVGRYEVFGQDRRVKRHKPEVLDADGVPIHVGDHVWFKQGTHYDGVEYVVTEVTKTQVHYKNSESEYPRGGCPHYCASNNLTHKEPDSLERIEKDAGKLTCEYFNQEFGDCENCEGFGGCHEKMALDLLRRQREVLGKTHG